MPVLGRNTLKRDFETGKGPTNRGLVAVTDSFLSTQDTTVQAFQSNLTINELTATSALSIGDASIDVLRASAGAITGLARQGVSGASATSTLGYLTTTQKATVAATATTQIALLPNSVNITGLTLQVLVASSGAGGGTEFQIGNAASVDYFGSITVSGVGNFKFSTVCARRLTGASGAVFAAGITATAGSNFVPHVEYYQVASATQSNEVVEITVFPSAIGNMISNGGLAAAFDTNTNQALAACAVALSTTQSFAGQAWVTAKKIARAIIYDPNNDGFSTGGQVTTIRLRGANTNDVTVSQVLASAVVNGQTTPTTALSFNESDIDTANAYSYHWATINQSIAAGHAIAEVRLWELV